LLIGSHFAQDDFAIGLAFDGNVESQIQQLNKSIHIVHPKTSADAQRAEFRPDNRQMLAVAAVELRDHIRQWGRVKDKSAGLPGQRPLDLARR